MTLPGYACMDERFKNIYKKGKMFVFAYKLGIFVSNLFWYYTYDVGILYNASYTRPETEPSHVFFIIILL